LKRTLKRELKETETLRWKGFCLGHREARSGSLATVVVWVSALRE
jgi:hypothetical protein